MRTRDQLTWLLATALLAAGCAAVDVPVPASPATPRTTVSGPTPLPTPTKVPAALPTWDPEPPHDMRYVPIDGLELAPDGTAIRLAFVGARPFRKGDPCTARYDADVEVVADVLEVGVFESGRGAPERGAGCDSMGFGRELIVELPARFSGKAWLDRYGPSLQFLEAPEGLVTLDGLPPPWVEIAAE